MAVLSFEDGTIRIEGMDSELSGVEYDPRSRTHRVPAYRYRQLRETLSERDIDYEDRVLDVPALEFDSAYELRSYQQNALEAWRDNDEQGVIELPTGSGKTVIGIKAIETCSSPALVVVPTIDLLEQWHRELRTEFPTPVGRLGGGTQEIEQLTVSTYDSAYLRADELGDRFGLVVFDEVHHLGGEGYRDIARLLAAPARLGLTATFERPDGEHETVAALIGECVYRLDADDLAGEHLASYDIKRLRVSLTPDERDRYEEAQGTFTDYLRRSNLTLRDGSDYQKLVMRSGTDPQAREALLAKQRARDIMLHADQKVTTLERLLDRHRDDRIIVFAVATDFVYRLSERFLIPAITHHTPVGERRDILDRFRDGRYSRIVTANVLDEGVDVPDATVGVVLAGSGSEREFTQRLGRLLRPGESERALLYEVVTENTTETNIAQRRR
ncbi:DEAD/DEAH box helicase [Halocatena salina]|uniref:DEAD/DEAH box helicase family protein n=1 Tax=Halocatena salina TaxID=2934340 RepID=A0A8U0A586_9EURY|nr:DEAD/DEAH box helicase family protein [Halocatena salina]UPM43979.1 DEAD/DEAH box helicase family protein [Halocatena salina]